MKVDNKDLVVTEKYLDLQRKLNKEVNSANEYYKTKHSDTVEAILFLKTNKSSLLKVCKKDKVNPYIFIFKCLCKHFPYSNKNKIRLELIKNFILPKSLLVSLILLISLVFLFVLLKDKTIIFHIMIISFLVLSLWLLIIFLCGDS